MHGLSGQTLIIFGCGYVGSAVAEWARGVGLRVYGLTRNPATAEGLAARGIHPVVADLAGREWHARVPERPEFVLNCVSSGGGGVDAYRHSYVAGMRSLVDWTRSAGPVGTLVYTGSTSVYPQDGGVRVDEASPTGGEGERPQLLLEAEAIVRQGAGNWRRWFVLRLAGIYGPGRHYLLDQVRSGAVAGHGEHHLNLIHRDDIVRVTAAAFTAPQSLESRVFNVVDDAPARKREVSDWLAGQLGLPPPTFTGLPAGGRRSVTPDRVITNARVKTELDWSPQYSTFREGYASLLSH